MSNWIDWSSPSVVGPMDGVGMRKFVVTETIKFKDGEVFVKKGRVGYSIGYRYKSIEGMQHYCTFSTFQTVLPESKIKFIGNIVKRPSGYEKDYKKAYKFRK